MPYEEAGRTTSHHESARKLAGGALVLAGTTAIAAVGFSSDDAVYDSLAFMYAHTATFLAAVLAAVGVTALVYAVRGRLGLAGILGSAFTWLSVSAASFWLMISWGAVAVATDVRNPAESIGPALAPMGAGMFAVTGLLAMLGLATTAVGLFSADVVHRALAGAGVLLGGVLGVAVLVSLALTDVAVLEALVAVSVLAWLWAILLGIALFRGARLSALDAETAGKTEPPIGE